MTAFFPATRAAGPDLVVPTPYDIMAASDDGAALAEAFPALKTPRQRRHLVKLAQELRNQELSG